MVGFDPETLHAACPQECFMKFDFGRLVRWYSVGADPDWRSISRIRLAARLIRENFASVCVFLSIISTLGGIAMGWGLWMIGLAFPIWAIVPGTIVVMFMGLFILNFYSLIFVDRVRTPCDVTIDYIHHQLIWKTARATLSRRLSEIQSFKVSLIGAPAIHDGVRLAAVLPDRTLVLLESTRSGIGIAHTLETLLPFAQELATPLAVPVFSDEMFLQILQVESRGVARSTARQVLTIGIILFGGTIYVCREWFHASFASTAPMLSGVIALTSAGIIASRRNPPTIILDREKRLISSFHWGRKTIEIDRVRASRVVLTEKIVRFRNGRTLHWFIATLELNPSFGTHPASPILLEKSMNRDDAVLTAIRVADFLGLPCDNPADLSSELLLDLSTCD